MILLTSIILLQYITLCDILYTEISKASMRTLVLGIGRYVKSEQRLSYVKAFQVLQS
jgi:hypothetical protein